MHLSNSYFRCNKSYKICPVKGTITGHAKERPSASERVRGSCCASEEYFSASERVRGIFLRVRGPFLRVRALFK